MKLSEIKDKFKTGVRKFSKWTFRAAVILILLIGFVMVHRTARLVSNLMEPIVIVTPSADNMTPQGNTFLGWFQVKWDIWTKSKPIVITRDAEGRAQVYTYVPVGDRNVVFVPHYDSAGQFEYRQEAGVRKVLTTQIVER